MLPSALISLVRRLTTSPGSATWRHRFDGQEWRYDSRGVYTNDGFGQEMLWRTKGEPVTCREIFKAFRAGMEKLGWIEENNVRNEIHSAGNSGGRLSERAKEVLRQKQTSSTSSARH